MDSETEQLNRIKRVELLEGKTKTLMETISRCNRKVELLVLDGMSEADFRAYLEILDCFREDLAVLETDNVI
jgi:hypothetical protein